MSAPNDPGGLCSGPTASRGRRFGRALGLRVIVLGYRPERGILDQGSAAGLSRAGLGFRHRGNSCPEEGQLVPSLLASMAHPPHLLQHRTVTW